MPESGGPCRVRLENEERHGRWIARHGEAVWNWSSPAGRLRWARRVAMFGEFLAHNGPRVLEIGCGTGLFTAELARSGRNITAIDVSPDLLELAAERVCRENVRFLREDAHATRFDSGSFDAIVGSSCLHHLEPVRALAEFHRLLRPGGMLLFTEPNMLNPQVALMKNVPWLKRRAGESPDETAFVRFALAAALKRSGFQEISIVPFDFLHPSLPTVCLPIAVPLLGFVERVPLLRELAGSLAITARKG